MLVNKQVETNPSALLRTGDIVDLYCEPGAVNAPTLLVPPSPRGPLALPLLRQAQAQAAQQQASARAPVVVAANSTLKVGGCVCALCLAWLCCIQFICAEVGSSVLHCVRWGHVPTNMSHVFVEPPANADVLPTPCPHALPAAGSPGVWAQQRCAPGWPQGSDCPPAQRCQLGLAPCLPDWLASLPAAH